MHTQILNRLRHEHDFSRISKKGERRTRQVLVLTFLTMMLEIIAGLLFGSMALLADGWHMATHVAAFLITLIAYRYSRVHQNDQTFAFSSAKVGVLGGYTGSIVLMVVALIMLFESCQRLVNPYPIHFDEAMAVAGFGLFINLLSAALLKEDGHHHEHHHDHNLKAAYLHVLTDALTSVLAIVALAFGKFYGWSTLDPLMGVVGALVITRWSYGLIKETRPILLDESIAADYQRAIKEQIENVEDNRVADLHIWRVGPGHFAVVLSVVSHHPKSPDYYKALLTGFRHLGHGNRLSHITVEVNQCMEVDCAGSDKQ